MSTVEVKRIVIKPLTSLLTTGQFSALQDCLAAQASAAASATTALSAKTSALSYSLSALASAEAASNAALTVPNVGTGPTNVPSNTYADSKYAPIAHVSNASNPHSVTKSQVGLGNVTNDAQIAASALDTDATLAANSDTKVASQKAVKAYVDGKQSGLTPMQTIFWA